MAKKRESTKAKNEASSSSSSPPKKRRVRKPPTLEPKKVLNLPSDDLKFIGEPFSVDEAKSKWLHRYHSQRDEEVVLITLTDGSTEEKTFYQAKFHYSQALVDGVVFNLNDDASFESPEGVDDFLGKIVEMFENWKGEIYVCVRWYYRASDTVMKDVGDEFIPKNKVFYSDVTNENPLGCINGKVTVAKVGVNMDAAEKESLVNSSDFYYDMTYSFPHAFKSVYTDKDNEPRGMSESVLTDEGKSVEDLQQSRPAIMLDLYAGCGAMSSGLCIGALLGGKNVVTEWAVDNNQHACDSYRNNHPNTKVYHYDAEDFLKLLKAWERLNTEFSSDELPSEPNEEGFEVVESAKSDITTELNEDDDEIDDTEYEVEELLEICYGKPNKNDESGLYFKVHWKGYGSEEDSWEPFDGLREGCPEKIREFVRKGRKDRLLPLPGDVDIICGGPPCQGISGFNRYRKSEEPMDGEKNSQLIVYMNTIQLVQPKHVLMENVTDILKFAGGELTHYAVARLVSMKYQARLGVMAAGAYGVPQCRMRFFLWGAGPTETLPNFPLPTHKIMKKGVVINEYKECVVGHMEEHIELLDTVLLADAISDLPEITNFSDQDTMQYGRSHDTDYQKFIRLMKREIFGCDAGNGSSECLLYDHRPYKCNDDDYERVCRIPKKKGANFRDLPGLIIDADNVVRRDKSVKEEKVRSGKPLVPGYAITYESGKSTKPFGRLWMDEIVGTVVGRPEPHNQAIIHWSQDRVLSVRENARLQGFPDCYKLSGPVKERYTQVGNAVSFSASVPLGYCLAKAMQGRNTDTPLSLPFKFPDCFGELQSCRLGKQL